MGQSYSEPSDVWVLGVIFFELLTLQRPFAAPNIGALILKICAVEYEAELLRQAPHPTPLLELVMARGACCAASRAVSTPQCIHH